MTDQVKQHFLSVKAGGITQTPTVPNQTIATTESHPGESAVLQVTCASAEAVVSVCQSDLEAASKDPGLYSCAMNMPAGQLVT